MFMRMISEERFVATKALIQFEDGPLSLCIPRGATLGDLSEKLHNICKWHRGGALSIDVRFGAANGSGRAAAHSPVSFSNSERSIPSIMTR
jgi:hypothetical protein